MLFSDLSLGDILFFVIAFCVILYLIINAPNDSESHKECGSSKAISEKFKVDKSKKV
jgi:hypothetical protein